MSNLEARIKNSLLESSRTHGCRLSEFSVIGSWIEPSRSGFCWVDFAWDLDNCLCFRLELREHQTYLTQSYLVQDYKTQKSNKNTSNIPFRWGKELQPALQFSPDGKCQLTEENVQRLVQQFVNFHNGLQQIITKNKWQELVQQFMNLPKEFLQLILEKMPEIAIYQPSQAIKLTSLLQNDFSKVIKVGWELAQVRSVRSIAEPVKMTKPIKLNANHTVVFEINLHVLKNREIKVLLRLHPYGDKKYLPENLKLIVFDKSDGKAFEKRVQGEKSGLQQPWQYQLGEQFSVIIQLDEMSVIEHFVI
ncbi:MAG: DUF1822 family protein [Candidatus Parabeggiatoa sp.]|nr:DUF1822 family protein [Candidatus Parabeggiatoa sp.]